MGCNRNTAAMRLTNRWHEQVLLFPTMRDDIPLSNYIRANVGHVMKHDLLKEYEK